MYLRLLTFKQLYISQSDQHKPKLLTLLLKKTFDLLKAINHLSQAPIQQDDFTLREI